MTEQLDPMAASGYRILPLVIDVAVQKKIKVTLTLKGYEISGFYKQENIELLPNTDGVLYFKNKSGEKILIETFDKLVELNFSLWKTSRNKNIKWATPEKEWADEFERLKLVEKQIMYIPKD